MHTMWEKIDDLSSICKDRSFIEAATTSRFGSFILHAAAKFDIFRENALVMLSSVSESESETYFGSNGVSSQCVSRSESSSSSSSHWWSHGSNGVCGRCVFRSGSRFFNWGKTANGLCVKCGQWSSYSVAEFDDQMFKLDDYDQQQQQQLVLKLDNLGFPSCYNFGAYRPIFMVGSCNGVICLSDLASNDVSLLNPATKQFRILPKSIIMDGEDTNSHHLVAFGFDHETKDYKVVLVTVSEPLHYAGPVKHTQCVCRIQIYSLSTDSWRVIEGINYLPGYPLNLPNSVLYLNGSCFFMAEFLNYNPNKVVGRANNRFVISFDLTKEIIIPMQLPNHHQGQELYLCYLGEEIALFTAECYVKVAGEHICNWVRYEDFKLFSNDVTGCYEEFTIWVLNDYGGSDRVNKKSWRQLHLFRIEHVPGEWHMPRGISNDGEFALLETRDMDGGKGGKKMMKLFNLVSYQLKKNFLSCDEVMSIANAYKPSLVSIVGGNGRSSSSG